MATSTSKKAQVREANTRAILQAAEEVFAEVGFAGASTGVIADRAGLPKANLHYYFPTKHALYRHLLEDILAEWIGDAAIFDISDDPETVFRAYIERKMRHSFSRPDASKIWAMEIISRGQVFEQELKASVMKWNRKKVAQIRRWVRDGRLAPVDPQFLLYGIWATTQHYADFEHQIRALNGGRALSARQQEEAIETVTRQFLSGVMPRDGGR